MARLLLLLSLILSGSLRAQEPELVVQAGHTAWINDYAVSPDGRYMATASVDNNVKLWDLRSNKEIRTFRGHKEAVGKVAFSHNGLTLASGDDKGGVYLWDVRTGALRDTFQHGNRIRGLAFSADDSRLASIGNYALLDVRDLATRAPLTATRLWAQAMRVEFVPASNNLVGLIAADSTFQLWDIRGDSVWKYIQYARAAVTDFTLSRNGRYVISTLDQDSSIRVFDLKDWRTYKRIYSAHAADCVVLGDDDSTIYTSANYKAGNQDLIEIKKWNFHNGRLLDSGTVATESWYNPKLAYAASQRELIFKYRESLLAITRTDALSTTRVLKMNGTLVNIVLEKSPRTFMLIAEKGPVMELNANNNMYRVLQPSSDRGVIIQMALLPDPAFALARMGTKPELYKINLKTLEREVVIRDSNRIRYFSLSPDAKRVAYYCTQSKGGLFQDNSAIVVKNFANDSTLFRKSFPAHGLYLFELLDEGNTLVYQEKIDTITLLDLASGATSYLTDSNYRYQNFSTAKPLPGGRLITFTDKGKFYVWSRASGRLLQTVNAHESFIFKVTFSADSSQFLSFGDEVVKLWDSRTLALRQSFHGHESWVNEGGFLAGEMELYTCSADQTFRIWDVASGKERASFMLVDTADMVTRLPNKYYASTKQGTKFLSYRIGNELYPFEQFDLQYNRPHTVLEALGSRDTALIDAYRKAYERRLRKAGFREADFNSDIHLPETSILNSGTLPAFTKRESVTLNFALTDSKYNIDRYLVSVNNVPVNGSNGTSLKHLHRSRHQGSLLIRLASGINRIEVSCMNEKGVESIRKEVYVTFQPEREKQPNVYFIGIGVSRYKDARYNLTYADKDTRDLATLFKSRYPQASIDTLMNEAATADAIKALKAKLRKTAIDDIVIISVSSHGLLDKAQNYYIATHDVAFDNPALRGLRYEDLEGLLSDIPARKKLLLIDACHSGEVDKEAALTRLPTTAVITDTVVSTAKGIRPLSGALPARLRSTLEVMNELFADVSRGNGAVVIGAAGGQEYAFENAQWSNGVFTYCVKKALAEGLADGNKDGVSVGELHKYLSEQVYRLTDGRQRPTTRRENIGFDWKLW